MKVVILTPIPVEHEAVYRHLQNIKEKVIGSHFYIMGDFKGQHHDFKVITEETGSKNTIISLAAQQAINHFAPDIVLLIGIAGGVKDVALGDIVVGTKSYGYESGKEVEGGIMARPDSFMSSKELQALAKSVKFKGLWQKRSESANESTKVLFGPIAGGDKVIATSKGAIYPFIKKHYNDTLAVEMEAYGFGEALANHQSIRWLNIRSISDLLDSKSLSDSGGSQERAAANAAAFAFELLDVLKGNHVGSSSNSKEKEKSATSINISRSKNVVTGSINATGNVYIGDGINVQEILESRTSKAGEGTVLFSLQEIKDHMTNDKIKEALEGLLVYTKEKDPDLHNDIIAQSGRWNRLNRDNRQGIIASEELRIIHNRIRYSILSIIEELED